LIHGWPDFDVSHDPFFQTGIRPFIDEQLALLNAYDDRRIERHRENPDQVPEITYKFYEHALRVADDVAATCKALGLSKDVQDNMRAVMLVHDIGKHTIDITHWDSIEKPDGKTKEARRNHTLYGIDLIDRHFAGKSHPFLDLMRDIVRHHHEHMDGSGHLGLKAEDLSMPVRLACIVESYDGYTIRRPHFGDRDISPAAVLEKMRNEDGKGAAMFDMDLFEAFAKMKLNQTEDK
jgi:HD-GYP domain-containing protein (c-di-GMP phosphodiesterase class II)